MNGKPNAPIDINGAMNKGVQPGEIIMKKHSVAPRSLLLAGLACGWPGAWLAQRWLRHKSSKTAFLWRFRITVLLNAAAVAAIVYTSSHVALS